MCSRHQSLNGADNATDPRDSERIVLHALARCRAALARRDIGAVVLILREFSDHPAEHELLTAMLEADPEPSRMGPMSERGQAIVEAALVLPLLLLVTVAGLILGLATFDRQSRTWEAQEAAYAASTAGAEDSACDSARAAAEAVSGRSYAACDGSDGLTMDYAPAASPPTVTIRLDGGSYPVPFLDTVTVAGEAGAIIRPSETPAPSEAAP